MTSFSIDTTQFMSMAAQIFNGLFPVFGVILGIVLGIGLLVLVVKEIRSAI